MRLKMTVLEPVRKAMRQLLRSLTDEWSDFSPNGSAQEEAFERCVDSGLIKERCKFRVFDADN